MADTAVSAALRVATFRIDTGLRLPGEEDLEVAVEVVAPETPLPLALVCLPGGAMTRQYFDLVPPHERGVPGDDTYSFARQMAARGFVCVLVDPLGIGESSRPQDSYALTADLVAAASARATDAVLGRLRMGGAVPGLPPLPDLRSVGVGHSMGAMITVLQQAARRQHAGVAVLGFSTRGLPEYLPAEVRAMDPATARRNVVELARAMFRENYPVIGRSAEGASLYAGDKAEPAGVQAVKAARAPLLPVPAYQSMLPGNVAPEAAGIDVPVFVALGELDIAGPPRDAPAAFTASPAVTLHLLPQAGHSHFLFPARFGLYAGLADWAARL